MNDLEFNAEFYKHTPKTMDDFENRDTKYDTGPLPPVIDTTSIGDLNIEDIRNNDIAFAMFVNRLRESENFYQKAMKAAAKAQAELKEVEQKSKDRKTAVILMTVAEIITSIGIGGMFTDYESIFMIVVFFGLIATAISLYFNFRK